MVSSIVASLVLTRRKKNGPSVRKDDEYGRKSEGGIVVGGGPVTHGARERWDDGGDVNMVITL